MDSLLPFLYDSFIRDNIPVYPGVLGNRYPFLQFFKPFKTTLIWPTGPAQPRFLHPEILPQDRLLKVG